MRRPLTVESEARSTRSFPLTRVVIVGSFPECLQTVRDYRDKLLGKIEGTSLLGFGLTIADPPYGNIVDESWDTEYGEDKAFAKKLIEWSKAICSLTIPGGAYYMWGGIGKVRDRPFFRALIDIEHETDFQMANLITWSKKRAYGLAYNYLFTREELAYFIKGDIRKPYCFNVPLLDEKRGYAGYNAKYPAKSEFFRRTNVWTDINEIFKGKTHPTQKPDILYEKIIQVHTKEGHTVFDPFAGSLIAARAATKLNRGFVCVERNREYVDKHLHTLPSDTIVIKR